MQVILPTEQVQEIQLMITELLQHEISHFKEALGLDSPYLNKIQACQYLRISNNTLDSWIQKGLPVIKIGKTVRFHKNEIDRWLCKEVML
ncbi:helix-turn-helix domain-containing protein [Streptococcus equi]|uniref:Helix-turn-helix domain-containing protein n=1 Tax=Streptococcus equi subsp. ruminatorum TaxID=254358 RepID=A0A6M1KYC3_9STRE|nr:helix-turn-helix domain-containing protein [Streptococcus equi]NGL84091.1 helix-turn-helix domain-containing protein [Streptococcus equi subsp. ruminatorum]